MNGYRYGTTPSFIGGAGEMRAATHDYFSKDTVIAGSGVAVGMLAGEFVGDYVADYLGWTGYGRLAGLGIGKLGLGFLTVYLSRGMSGVGKTLLNGAAVGTMASFLVDVYTTFQGSLGSKGTKVVARPARQTVTTSSGSRGATVLNTNEL